MRAGSSLWNLNMNIPIKLSHCGTLLTAGLFLVLLPAQAEEQAPLEKPSSATYSGSLRGTYDYRGIGSEHDNDIYGYWYLRGRNLADKRVEIYTSGRTHSDLDGTSSGDYFSSIDDSSKGDIRLLQFYIDIHDQKNTKAVRFGRQYVDVADYIQMDGLQALLFEKQAIGGRVFAGRPASDYTSVSGDLFMGASLVGRPWKGNQSRATYARYEDDSESAADDHFFLDVYQQVADELRARGYLSVMNEDIRMGGADLFYVSLEEKVFDVAMGIRRWGDYNAYSRVYSPLIEALGDQEPYTTAYGRFTTQIMPTLYLSPGAMTRRPDESDATNRDFDRYDISLIYEPWEALSTTLAVEYWNVENEESFVGLSGDIRYRYRKLWDIALGAAYVDYTYYQLSDISVFTDDNVSPPIVQPLDGTRVERSPNAYTYFLRAKWNLTERMALRLSGEIEDDSTENDLSLRVRTSIEVRL